MTKYQSTRGTSKKIDFSDVILSGTADDGGVYIPDKNEIDFSLIKSTGYEDLVKNVFISLDKNSEKLVKSENLYKGFDKEPDPNLVELQEGFYLMELFHGPTESFKDYALQVLGALVDQQLKNTGEKGLAIVATSGDTGSAAIQGVKDSDNLDIVVLHPFNKISEYQRKQMTTVDSPNVKNLAVKGDYDDCQKLVKGLFSKRISDRRLVSLNSINWIRVVAQSSYYVWLSQQIDSAFDVVIPSGNFGNAYSAWYAKNNGIPIGRIICSTNKNDVLTRFIHSGKLQPQNTFESVAPSMDIQLPSSLERLIYDLYNDPYLNDSFYNSLHQNGEATLSVEAKDKLQGTFFSDSFNDIDIKSNMKSIYSNYGYLSDPHTATSISLAEREKKENPIVSIGTASPVKFQNVVNEVFDKNEEYSIELQENFDIIPNSLTALEEKII